MTTQYSTVIVFGPTGDVGSIAALEASKRGAKVWLAMRDPSKNIDGITKVQEQQGSFHRIQADLTNAESVKSAVQQSGAKAAYLYRVNGMEDSIQAMKDAGIEYVVFLSTSVILPSQDIRQIPQSDVIAYVHAKIEIALENASIAHTALRPAFFAGNVLRDLDRSKWPWEARVVHAHWPSDCIAPRDIGRVAGSVLVDRPSSTSKEIIYLAGPQLITSIEQWNIIKKVTGQTIEIVQLGPEEYTQELVSKGFAPPIVKDLVRYKGEVEIESFYPEQFYKEWVANTKKYSGYESTTFEEYIRARGLA
ncbi:hypothetical protein OHC33_002668 [Knufia fluminis]|uniref:NmrA-like domain-containing protein n=1 Tax=Knufia fluminis TaxID=191047 RepID=A0AAN8EKT3_9EURO|nr:hypothetical protein OHC33_002668 [Knufia fluminis]